METIITEYKTFENMVNEYINSVNEDNFNIGKQVYISNACENITFNHFLGYKYHLEADSIILCQWNHLFSNLDPENSIFNEVLYSNDYIYKNSSLNDFKEYIQTFLKGLEYIIEDSDSYSDGFSEHYYKTSLSDYIYIFTTDIDIQDDVDTTITYNTVIDYKEYFPYLYKSGEWYEDLCKLCDQYPYVMDEYTYDKYIEDYIYKYINESIPEELMEYFDYNRFEKDYRTSGKFTDCCVFYDLKNNEYVFFN